MYHAPHYGINRRDLDHLWCRIGGEVLSKRDTGEVVYRHPLLPQTLRADGRRKDAPAHLVRFVRRVMSMLAQIR